DLLGAYPIHAVGCLSKIGAHTKCTRNETKGLIVAREARATVAQCAGEIFATDPLVQAQGVGYHINVAPRNPLAQIGEHIRKGDLCGDERIDGNLCQLSVLQAHPPARRVVLYKPGVTGFELSAGPLVVLTNQGEIRVEEITDDAAQGDELGA